MTRKDQAATSRSRLLEVARQCFTELGYEGTTVSEILDRAGMARGALYHYFPGGKAEIFTAVFDMINDTFHQRRDVLLQLPSPLARLRTGVAVFLELCTEDDFARIALHDGPQVVLFVKVLLPLTDDGLDLITGAELCHLCAKRVPQTSFLE